MEIRRHDRELWGKGGTPGGHSDGQCSETLLISTI